MVDIGKQIQHWRSGADEDWDVAKELIGHDKIRHGLFLINNEDLTPLFFPDPLIFPLFLP